MLDAVVMVLLKILKPVLVHDDVTYLISFHTMGRPKTQYRYMEYTIYIEKTLQFGFCQFLLIGDDDDDVFEAAMYGHDYNY